MADTLAPVPALQLVAEAPRACLDFLCGFGNIRRATHSPLLLRETNALEGFFGGGRGLFQTHLGNSTREGDRLKIHTRDRRRKKPYLVAYKIINGRFGE